MSKIHLVGGEKGGVGKSVVARILAQYMVDHEILFRAFDTDRSHGSLLRFYTDYAVPTQVETFESLDAIIEAATEDNDKRILVDLAAQTFHPFIQWFNESGVSELTDELGISVAYWHVMDSGKDSVDLLAPLFDQSHPGMEYVLVKNELRGDNFDLFEQSEAKKRALELNAKIVNLKHLHTPVMNKIDTQSASFWAAQNKVPENSLNLGLMERQRVKMWMRQAYQALESVGI